LDLALDLIIKLVVVVVLMGLTSLAAAWALLRGFKPRGVVLIGTVTLAFFLAAMLLLIQANLRQDTFPFFQQNIDESWKSLTLQFANRGLSPENIEVAKVFIQKYFYYSLPAWLVLNSLFMGLLAYYLASAFLVRVTARVSRPIAFREWVVPEPLVFGLIAGGLLKIAFKENSPMDIVGNNFLVFFVGLYTLSGLSIVSFFFHKWRLPAAIRILSYLVLLNLIFETICCFGVLDIWFDFRKLKSAPPEPTPLT
jgi:uncharacterized protein YybS (DUF2232 family)